MFCATVVTIKDLVQNMNEERVDCIRWSVFFLIFQFDNCLNGPFSAKITLIPVLLLYFFFIFLVVVKQFEIHFATDTSSWTRRHIHLQLSREQDSADRSLFDARYQML